jgi:hypothetical protein
VELGIQRDETSSPYWQAVGASSIDFHDIHFKTNSDVLNNVLEMFHAPLVKYLRSYENGYG